MLSTTQKPSDSGSNTFAFSGTILTVLPPPTKHSEHPKDLGRYPIVLQEHFFQNTLKMLLSDNHIKITI